MSNCNQSLNLITAPSTEPCTIDELKKALNVVGSSKDSEILAYGKGCRTTLEKMLGICFVDSVYEDKLDCFPCDQTIELLRGPVLSIVEFKYVDTSGSEQALIEDTDYQIDKASKPARIKPAYGTIFPVVRAMTLAPIRIRYHAGSANADSVPNDLKYLLKIYVAMAFDQRLPISEVTGEVPVPVSFRQILANNRVWEF